MLQSYPEPHIAIAPKLTRSQKFQNKVIQDHNPTVTQEYVFQSSIPLQRFTVIEHFSLTPNSLAVYPRFYKNSGTTEKPKFAKISADSSPGHESIMSEKTAIRNSVAHNFELSPQARKNLRSKVTWLYHFAKKQTIVTRKGKHLTNLKMNFTTLKLPSEQIHPSDFITKNCLNQLFIEIKKKYVFENYVWRLEYQKNGNLHYHIATDTYIDYSFLLNTWNRILNKYGYVTQYTRKFSQFSLSDYIKNSTSGDTVDYSVHQERYAKGCREKWTKPNTVDVRAIFGASNIGYYISKYMAKKPEEGETKKLPVCELNSKNSRLWFCSRSLSALKTKSDIRECQEIDLYTALAGLEGVREYNMEYCTVLYFDINKLPQITQKLIYTILEEYRREVGYKMAG